MSESLFHRVNLIRLELEELTGREARTVHRESYTRIEIDVPQRILCEWGACRTALSRADRYGLCPPGPSQVARAWAAVFTTAPADAVMDARGRLRRKNAKSLGTRGGEALWGRPGGDAQAAEVVHRAVSAHGSRVQQIAAGMTSALGHRPRITTLGDRILLLTSELTPECEDDRDRWMGLLKTLDGADRFGLSTENSDRVLWATVLSEGTAQQGCLPG